MAAKCEQKSAVFYHYCEVESAKCGKPGVTSNFVTHMKVRMVGGY